jgi:hypothetical protein
MRKVKISHITEMSNTTYGQGEMLEHQIARRLKNKEDLLSNNLTVEMIYPEKKLGVQPEHDIRTDKIELAVDAKDRAEAMNILHSEEQLKKANEAKETDTSKEG